MTESHDFAMELFDTLSRRRGMQVDKINKDELQEIWKQITEDSFDSRLQIFFEMVDKNADGHITEAEVKEKDYGELAENVMIIVDRLVHKTDQKIEQSTDVLKAIIRTIILQCMKERR